MKIIRFINLLIICLLLFGCTTVKEVFNPKGLAPENQGNVNITIKWPKLSVETIPAFTTKLYIKVTGGFNPAIETTLYKSVGTNNIVTSIILKIPAGACNIHVDAKDDANTILASGNSSGVNIIANTQTPVTINLNTISPVKITSLSPLSGSVGDTIIINGEGFSTDISQNTVKFGLFTPATVLTATGTALTVKVPSNCPIQSNISVQAPAGFVESSALFTLLIPLNISTVALPNTIAGSAYNHTLAAAGGVPPYTWSLINGNLPYGIIFNPSSGVLSGTTYYTGNYSVTIKVSDSALTTATATKTFNIGVSANNATKLVASFSQI